MGEVKVLLVKHVGGGQRATAFLKMPAPPTVGSQVTLRPDGEKFTVLALRYDIKLSGYVAETQDIYDASPDHFLDQDELKACLDRLAHEGWSVPYQALINLDVLYDHDAYR